MSIMEDESMVTFSSMAVKEASLEAMSGDEWRGAGVRRKGLRGCGRLWLRHGRRWWPR
jgi:hypothetical protein